MSLNSQRPAESPSKKSFAYEQHKRSQRIYGLVGGSDYSKLGSADTAVLLALNLHSKVDGDGMRPSTATVALMTNLSRRTVVRALSRLLASGLLTMEAKKHKRAIVSYRFGTQVLTESSNLRELLEAKLACQQTNNELRSTDDRASATMTRRGEDRSATQSDGLRRVDQPVVPCGPKSSATRTERSAFVTHRTDSEQIEKQSLEQTGESRGTSLGASHHLDAASRRLDNSERSTYGRHCYTNLEFDPSEMNAQELMDFLGQTQ